METIKVLKLQFHESTGLEPEKNAADFAGWLFMQRQKFVLMFLINESVD